MLWVELIVDDFVLEDVCMGKFLAATALGVFDDVQVVIVVEL